MLSSILLRFAGLISFEEKTGISLQGLVKIKDIFYNINLRLPNFPELGNFNLAVRQGVYLRRMTESSAGFCDSWKVEELIENIPSLLASLNDIGEATPQAELEEVSKGNPTVSVTDFYAEIAALHDPEEYSVRMNKSCTLIRFCDFSTNDQHFLEVELPSLAIRDHSLPDCLKAHDLLSKCETLTALVEQFKKYIEELQPFYESFIAIDALCYVVQPGNPTTKHNHRIFVLRDRVFLKLVIKDPFAPLSSMILHIIGPTAEVEQLRRDYSEGLKSWDNDMDIHKNLLRIFGLCFFPMPPDPENDEQEEWFCNICYSYRLEPNERGGCDVPIVSCDNPQCTLIFHDACLLEWFGTLSDNVSFLNVSFGNCPFCKAKLSTSFQELTAN